MTSTHLQLSNGKTAFIDADLHPFLSRWEWSVNNSGYPSSSLGFLHHLCYGPRSPQERRSDICHANENKLDCRRVNLVAMPHWLNQVLNFKRSGRIKGIRKVADACWKVEVQVAGSKLYLGCQRTFKAAVTLKAGMCERIAGWHLDGKTPNQIKDLCSHAT